jgi:hypothetical protein
MAKNNDINIEYCFSEYNNKIWNFFIDITTNLYIIIYNLLIYLYLFKFFVKKGMILFYKY